MIRVILKDGRVLQYNSAKSVRAKDGMVNLEDKEFWYAMFNLDVVERVEGYTKPCLISKEKRDKKKMKVY